jgi:hypothetical protein
MLGHKTLESGRVVLLSNSRAWLRVDAGLPAAGGSLEYGPFTEGRDGRANKQQSKSRKVAFINSTVISGLR